MSVPSVARFTLDELAESSGVPKRTIRFYIAEGLISPAAGRSRSAYYTPTHLQELEQVKLSRERGLSIPEIRDMRVGSEGKQLRAGVAWERVELHPALELHIRGDAPRSVRQLADWLLRETDAWFGEPQNGERDDLDSVQFKQM
jgi:DNA-binding transcriptional MerR regulator